MLNRDFPARLRLTPILTNPNGNMGCDTSMALFAASAFRKLSSVCVFSCFPFGFEGRMWDLIVSVSFYFAYQSSCGCAMWWP